MSAPACPSCTRRTTITLASDIVAVQLCVTCYRQWTCCPKCRATLGVKAPEFKEYHCMNPQCDYETNFYDDAERQLNLYKESP